MELHLKYLSTSIPPLVPPPSLPRNCIAMQKWQLRPSRIGQIRRVTCTHRLFNSSSQCLRSDDTPSTPNSQPPRQFNARQTSARASQDIKGLRYVAPGGFARPSQKPADRGQQARRRTASGQNTVTLEQSNEKGTSSASGQSFRFSMKNHNGGMNQVGTRGNIEGGERRKWRPPELTQEERAAFEQLIFNSLRRLPEEGRLAVAANGFTGDALVEIKQQLPEWARRHTREWAQTTASDLAKLSPEEFAVRQEQAALVAKKRNKPNVTTLRGREKGGLEEAATAEEENEDDPDDPTPQQELEFIDSLEDHIKKPAIRFAPETFTHNDLITNRIATSVGPLGAFSEIDEATSRLAKREDTRFGSDAELARKLMAGRLVKFKDDAEKIRVTSLAEGWAGDTANKIQEKLGEPVETLEVGFVPVGPDVRKSLTDKVVRGHYKDIKAVNGNSVKDKSMDHLAKSVLMNGSYTPTAGKTMLDYIEKMWPPQSEGPAPPKQ
jgi:hypothetical protein